MPQYRCAWADTDPLHRAYHDEEWGVPEHDGRALWEALVLDGFQAGLAWITILRKRETFRAAFHQFDPEKVARYKERDIERLLQDPGIIRSRAKIEATISSARIFLEIEEKGPGFSNWIWEMAGGAPVQNQWSKTDRIPAKTELSEQMSKEFRKRGFKFVGPVIVYAWMQAVGIVNDHAVECFRYRPCRKLGK